MPTSSDIAITKPEEEGEAGLIPLTSISVHLAAQHGYLKALIHICTESPGLINSVNNPIEQLTPLLIASKNGHEKSVGWLIDHGAYVNQVDAEGNTALFLACSHGHKQLVEVLLQKGAFSSIGNKEGTMPLMIAAGKGYTEIMQLLLGGGAGKGEEGGSTRSEMVNARNIYGSTALFFAASYGRIDVTKVLLDAGADPLIAHHKRNRTPIDVARACGYQHLVRLFEEALVTRTRGASQTKSDSDYGIIGGIESLTIDPSVVQKQP